MSASEAPVQILLVDDEPANLLALEAILGDLGHTMVRATFGHAALARLAEQSFAVVLLDVQMAGLDGFETARRIRSQDASRHTPIIFLTGHDENRERVEEAYSLGAVDYLVKPLLPVVLRAKVAVFVELFKKTEQLRLIEREQFERKLAEENARAAAALRESEQRFSGFMQHLTGLAWIKDLQGRYVFANDAALRIFQRPPAVLYGKTDDEVFDPTTAAEFKANDRQVLASGTGVQVVETLCHADGVVHHSLVSKFPIPGPDGQPACVGGMAIDITERIEAEAKLKEADRRKDEFLAMLAHELRNPLAPIRNALYVLRLPATAGHTAAEALAMVERQVHNMVRLVDDLLDVSRITRGKIQLRTEPLDLATILQRAVEATRPLIEANRHTLTMTLTPQPARVVADPTRLEQIFANLLNNAAKYTERGGAIAVVTERDGPQVVVRVRDTGFGIPPAMLPHIFNLFTQGERTLERAQGGLGIGLTLVKTLVEMHGGAVEAHSAGPGQGSEFIVRLPVAAEPSSRPEPTPALDAGAAAGTGLHVLVVEDNQDAADSLAILLQFWGHEVRTAHDGLSGLKAARSYRPQVVFLDIGLPGLDGYEVARQLRQEYGGKVRLVAMTGYGQDDDRRRAREAGFDAHFVKPVDPALLQRLLSGPLAG
jgi:PAS domain S-box-containing protein